MSSLLEMAILFLFVFYCLKKVIYFWRHWVFIAMCGHSLMWCVGGYSSLCCAGFSLQCLLLLWSTGSRAYGLDSCGTWVYLVHGVWNPPGPGMEPVSPALQGRFLTTVPPGTSLYFIIYFCLFFW